MPFEPAVIKKHLRDFALRKLFNELGWDRLGSALDLSPNGIEYHLDPIAQKRGLQVFECRIPAGGEFPDHTARRKIEREVAKSAHEHLLIFTDAALKRQIWQWVRRDPGGPPRWREHHYVAGQPGDALVQKLQHLAVGLDDEEDLGLTDVRSRTRQAFDVDRVTKRFYERFKAEHKNFLAFIQGIVGESDRAWYASLMLNRLMFVYFIQKKRFLDDDPDYLRHKLQAVRQLHGNDQFVTFYRYFLLRLFHEGLGARESRRPRGLDKLLGKVPYLNGGLFDVHDLEQSHPDIQIPDEAFEKLFDFFDAYQWHLDDRPVCKDDEINPDVLGFIFEKYINQKQMGAYYTKEDITGYIARNTLLPFLLGAARQQCAIAFRPDGAVWKLLREDPDRYLYPEVRKGVDLPLPAEIAAGLDDVNLRGGWNRAAEEGFRLPTESWREHVARRRRCLELRERLRAGGVVDVNDLVTLNLDVRQFTEDVIQLCEGPELLRAVYQAITRVSVLDPTCGSGAFLFAALNLLDRLYDGCLERMQAFVDEADHAGAEGREKFTDFREILSQVEAHPNRRYFILKSIIVQNLYGVDIMEEAVEICKLRLFLKLVAQVDKTAKLEPLPDIDFNIRPGNTLVGFATLDEVGKCVGLFSQEEAKDIQQRANVIDGQLRVYRQIQTEFGPGALDASEAKAGLRRELHTLRDKLDRYLAGVYDVDPDKADVFRKWHDSHRPFHWIAEFYSIMNGGGFDVVIGNPPYVEYTRSKVDYQVQTGSLESAVVKNLYAFCMDRSTILTKNDGFFGMIVPSSLLGLGEAKDLRDLLLNRYATNWFSTYSIRPSKLFDGVDQRLCIHIATNAHVLPKLIWTSRYLHWNSEERPHLFAALAYQSSFVYASLGRVVQLGDPLASGVIAKLIAKESARIDDTYSPISSPHILHYHRSPRYWIRGMDFEPHFKSPTRSRSVHHFRDLYFRSTQSAHFAGALLNSSLFFYWFLAVGNGRNLTGTDVAQFPIGYPGDDINPLLGPLFDSLMKDFRLHAVLRVRRDCEFQEFHPAESKAIIDRIDRVLAKHYGFTEEELDFILNYDIKYRMGQDDGAEDDA